MTAVLFQPRMGIVQTGNDTNTKALLHFNGADGSSTVVDDNRSAAKTWTASAATLDDADKKFGNSSGLFTGGSGNWVDTPDHADFNTAAGAFTIDCWIRTASGTDGLAMWIYGQGNNGGFPATTAALYFGRHTDNTIRGVCCNSTVNTNIFSAGTVVVATGWVHVAFVRTGNILRMFLNGTQSGSDVAYSATVNNSTNKPTVARAGEVVTNTWNGWIDEFRFSNVARWTTTFTVPAYPYG